VIDRIIKAIWWAMLLFFAAHNWHIYIREKRHEEKGWFALMAAIGTTTASVYTYFMW
jgi:hypothetical protein